MGHSALESAFGQNANPVACFISQYCHALLRQCSVQIDPGNGSLSGNRQLGGGKVGFGCGKVCFCGGNTTSEPVPKIGFPTRIKAQTVNSVRRSIKITANFKGIGCDSSADGAVNTDGTLRTGRAD